VGVISLPGLNEKREIFDEKQLVRNFALEFKP
jgi:hypothetical protein